MPLKKDENTFLNIVNLDNLLGKHTAHLDHPSGKGLSFFSKGRGLAIAANGPHVVAHCGREHVIHSGGTLQRGQDTIVRECSTTVKHPKDEPWNCRLG